MVYNKYISLCKIRNNASGIWLDLNIYVFSIIWNVNGLMKVYDLHFFPHKTIRIKMPGLARCLSGKMH